MFELTLSFDNGPEADVTSEVLDVLGAYHLSATFFVIGEKLARPGARAVVERAAAEGHWIGNHTWTHATPLGEGGAEMLEAEIGRTERALGGLAHPDKFFRPFAGGGGILSRKLLSRASVDYLIQGRYTCVLWNSVPKDWEDPDGWVETALAMCRSQLASLLVLHDLPTGAMRHLSRFLDGVLEAGGQIRQDFPAICVPIRRGEAVGSIDAYVTPTPQSRRLQ